MVKGKTGCRPKILAGKGMRKCLTTSSTRSTGIVKIFNAHRSMAESWIKEYEIAKISQEPKDYNGMIK